jgi:hypothetical protein
MSQAGALRAHTSEMATPAPQLTSGLVHRKIRSIVEGAITIATAGEAAAVDAARHTQSWPFCPPPREPGTQLMERS